MPGPDCVLHPWRDKAHRRRVPEHFPDCGRPYAVTCPTPKTKMLTIALLFAIVTPNFGRAPEEAGPSYNLQSMATPLPICREVGVGEVGNEWPGRSHRMRIYKSCTQTSGQSS